MNTSRYNLLIMISSLGTIFSSCSKSKDQQKIDPPVIIHKAHLPPGWYAQDAVTLNKDLDGYLTLAQKNFPVSLDQHSIKVLIAPHAGYYYSGLCAASVYQTLLSGPDHEKNKNITRVIVLAPSHTTFYSGIALPDYTVYRTVLGDIPVDTQALKILQKTPHFQPYSLAHATEHAVEMQLPLLQKTIEMFSLVPLVVGRLSQEALVQATKALSKIIDDTTLVVISSDFMHHGPDFECNLFNKNILEHVRFIDSQAVYALSLPSLARFDNVVRQTGATICGTEPLRLLLGLLETQALGSVTASATCYYTSANLAHARHDNVFDVKKLFASLPDTQAKNSVSYVGMVFATAQEKITGYERQALLTLARQTLENAFKPEQEKLSALLLYPLASPGVLQPAGAFVTLYAPGRQLRGCIGRITTTDPLCTTIHDMSLAAAFQDTRFTPLKQQELETLSIEISLLTPPVPIESPADIILGKHGIILKKHGADGAIIASSVFLPQVPHEFGWDVNTTLEQLCLKAGIAPDAWKEHCSFEVFEGIEIQE